MFVVHGHREGDEEPRIWPPVRSFESAASIAIECVAPLVIEFSRVYGWLAVWHRVGDRFELLAESADAYATRAGAP